MKQAAMTKSEYAFAKLIWQNEPVTSTELVVLCEKELSWRKSTTYTVIKKLCQKGIIKNENAKVSSCLSEKQYLARQGSAFVRESFGGSLPSFLNAFFADKALSATEAEELMQLIEAHTQKNSGKGGGKNV